MNAAGLHSPRLQRVLRLLSDGGTWCRKPM